MSTDTTPVRWGILATGAIAEKLAADVPLVPGNELAAVGSRRLDNAQAFAERFGVARAHGSYEELAADPDVDVVYVATPHGRHLEDALLCLEHGKAVLCEKALTLDQPDAQRLVSVAREKNLFLAEAMWMRVHPLVRRVKEMVDQGALGEVRQLRADLGFVAGGKSRLWDPSLGASALLDVGIYPLTFAHLVLGAPERITADGVLSEHGFDLTGGATLTYASGAVATISWSQVTASDSRASVSGSEGRIDVNAPMHHPTSATFTTNGEVETLTAQVTGYGYAHEVAEVAECLRRGDTESRLLPLDETVAILGQMDAIRAQIAEAAGAAAGR